MRSSRVSLLAAAVVAATACGKPDSTADDACGPNGECPAGYTCVAATNRCVFVGAQLPDAAVATPDAPPPAPDAGEPQAIDTELTATPDERTRDDVATFTFTGTPADAAFECSLDGGAFAACSSPQSFANLAEASHTLRVRATSGGGVDDTPATFTWVVDRTGPVAVITGGPSGPTGAAGTFTYATAPLEPDATFECALDARELAACAQTGFGFSGLAHGSAHAFRVRAVDSLGNRGPEASRAFTVDIAGPAVAIVSPPHGGTVGVTFALVFTFDAEPGATFSCRLDQGEARAPCAPGAIFTTTPGPHTVTVQGKDARGNEGPAASSSFTAAKSSTVEIVFPTEDATTGPSGDVVYTTGDAASVRCTLDRADVTCALAGYHFAGLRAGKHTFTVSGVNAAGEAGAADGVTWNVDTTGPTVAIDRPTDVRSDADSCSDGTITLSCAAGCPAMAYECRLDSGALQDCSAGTLAFADLVDGTHTLDVTAVDEHGNRGAAASLVWQVDGRAPALTIERPVEEAGPTTGPAGAITLAPLGRGASLLSCVVDGAASCCTTSPCDAGALAFSGLDDDANPHLVTVTVADGCGNERARQRSWRVDSTPPVAVITAGPAAGQPAPRSGTFELSTADPEPDATFLCALDGAALAPCANRRFAFTDLATGSAHTFRVLAVDAFGNRGPTASRAFTVAPTATVDIVAPQAGATTGRDAKIAYTTANATAARCTLDGKPVNCGLQGHALSDLADGMHTFTARGVNVLGDAGPADSVTWNVDATAPVAVITGGPAAGGVSGASGTFTYSTKPLDTAATFECSLDGAAFAGCATTGFPFSGLADGSHTFRVRATDGLGNRGPTASRTFTVDTQGPGVGIDDPGTTCATGRITFHCSGDCPASRFECRIDGKAVECGGGAVSFSGLSDGTHKLEVRAFDASGNAGGVATLTWEVNGDPPSFSIVSPVDTRPAPSSDSSGDVVLSTTALDVVACTVDQASCCTTSPCDAGALAFSELSERGNPHTVTVTVADECGNRATGAVSWNVDTTAPSITAISVTDTVAGDGTLRFVASVADASQITHVFTRFDREATSDRGPGTSVTTTRDELSAGEHRLEVYAVDEWGNSGLAAQPDASAPPSRHAVATGVETYPPNMGRLVALGHDGVESSGALVDLLGNAVNLVPFRQIPLDFGRPIHIVGVDTGGVTDGERKNVLAGIDARLAELGATSDYADLEGTSAAALGDGLLGRDVLLVFDQNADGEKMSSLGAAWHDRLAAFLDAGGVVLLLDGRTGEDTPSQTVALVAAGDDPLLDAFAYPYTVSAPVLDSDFSDHPLRAGVGEEYAPPTNSVGLETEADRGQPIDLYSTDLACGGECSERGATVVDKIFPVYTLGVAVAPSPSGGAPCPTGTIDVSIAPTSGPGFPTGATTTCELDGEVSSCKPGDSITYRTGDGPFPFHELVFRLEDVHGNPGRLQRAEFYVDTSPPTVVIDFKDVCLEPENACPTGYTCNLQDHICYQNRSRNISDTLRFWTSQFEAPGATFACKIDPGGTFVPCPCAAPYQDCSFSYSAQSCGTHTFTVQAQDECGPSGGGTSTRSFDFDIFCGPF